MPKPPNSWPDALDADADTSAPPPAVTDQRLSALLGVVWRYGLFPVAILAIAAFLVYRLDTAYVARLDAHTAKLTELGEKIDRHQAAMDQSEARRQAAYDVQIQRLKGICYGVTEEGSRARAFCEAD